MEFIRLLLIGILVGIANVIPGVSGGTLIVVFGIYEKFISIITFNVKKIIKNWKFVVPVILGMACGVLLFSKVIKLLYDNFPAQTNYFFGGLILGSIPMLFMLAIKKYGGQEKLSGGRITSIVLGIIAGIALILVFEWLQMKFNGNEKTVFELPAVTAPLLIKIFFAGILGAVAMIIPGISGSLLMLIVGVYPIVITAIPSLLNPQTFVHALILLLPNGVGVIIGLVAGAKLIDFLLKRFPNCTYAVIVGLLAGSAVVTIGKTIKDIQITSVLQGIACAVCLVAGAAMAFFSTKLAPSDDKDEKKVEEQKASEEN